MNLNFKHLYLSVNAWFIIYSVGIAQGIFLIIAIILVRKRRYHSATLLVLLLLCPLTLLFSEWVNLLIPRAELTINYRTGETIGLLIGPLFYLYILSALYQNFRFKKIYYLHFLPFLISVLIFLPFYLQPQPYKQEYIRAIDENDLPLHLIVFSIFKGIHNLFYLVWSWWTVRQFQKNTGMLIKKYLKLDLITWLINLQIIGVLAIYGAVAMDLFSDYPEFDPDQYSALIVTFSYFLFGFILVLNPESLLPKDIRQIKSDRYKSSDLSESEKFRISEELVILLEQKEIYRDADLSLSQLAALLNCSSNHLSQVINEIHDQNFYQFIGQYRITAVKKNIHDNNRSLLGIALNSGFNSKSAFNRVFKDLTGMTPSEYKKSVEN